MALTQLGGLSTDYGQRANLVRDVLRARDAADSGDMMDQAKYVMAVKAMRDHGINNEDLAKGGGLTAYANEMAKLSTSMSVRQAAVGGLGVAAWEQGMTMLTDYQKRTLDVSTGQLEVLSYLKQQQAQGNFGFNIAEVLSIMRNATDDPAGRHTAMSAKPNVNITIQRIEVQSDDLDRYAFQLVDAFRDAVKNPSAAVRAIREG